MQRVVRSTFAGLLILAGLTACGDKITVPPATTAPAGTVVHSVTVSPNSVSLKVGDKVTLAASVDADAGVTNRGVTWSSSSATVATVDANGTVTAVAGGTATIIAKSVADPTVQGAAVVQVAATVAATVTIGQINQTVCVPNGACTSIPANLSNVANQLDVTLNVDPGTQTLAGVDLIMNCGGADTVVATQNLGSASLAPAAEESNAPVTLSFNTAAFTAATGAVAFKNGACTIKGRARTSTGTQTASSTTSLTLNNIDFVLTTTTTTPSSTQIGSASDASGLVWRAGAVNVTAVPVMYSGTTIASATITLVNGGFDGALGRNGTAIAGLSTVTSLSGLTPTGGVITASFPNSTSSNTAGAIGGSTIDTLFTAVATVNSQGNAGPSVTLPTPLCGTCGSPVGTSFIRLDNRAPTIAVAPIVNLNVQNAQNNWVGSAFVFSTTGSSKAITLDATTLADNACPAACGVDVVKAVTQWRPAGSSTAFATFAKTTDLAETSAATSYDLRLMICDALNNCNTADNGGLFWQFGVDLTAPTLSQASGTGVNNVKDGDVFSIATGAPVSASFIPNDPPGAGGVSGSGPPNSGQGLLVKNQQLKPRQVNATTLGSATVCAIGTSTGTAPSQTCSGPIAQNNLVPLGGFGDGEFAMTVNAVDQAGNQSAAVTIKYYNDQDVPVLPAGQGFSTPNPITTGTVFGPFTASDSMDVKAGYGSLVYAAGSFAETGSATPAGATFDNVLTQGTNISVTLSTFYRSLTTAAGSLGTVPSTLNVNAQDAAGNLSSTALAAPLPANNIGTPVILNTGSNAITGFAIDSTKPAPATADPGKPITYYVNVVPQSDQTGNPFAQVCFYFQPVTNNQFGSGAKAGDLVKINCVGPSGTIGVGASRRFFFQFAWTPPAAFINSGAFNVYAVGATGAGDAMISGAAVTTVNPTPP